MKERIKELAGTWIPILAAFLLTLVFIGIHAFIYQHNYEGYESSWLFLVLALGAMAVTWIMFHRCKILLVQLADVEIPYLLVSVVIAVSIFMLLVTAEVSNEVISVSNSRILDLGLFKIQKKWLFDPYVIIVFPAFVGSVLNGLKKNDTTKNRIMAVAAIALLNISSVLIFSQMASIYLVEMAVLNFFTVDMAVILWDTEKMLEALDYDEDEDSSVWDEDYEEHESLNWLWVTLFYYIFWTFLLMSTMSTSETLTEYMYSGNWSLRKQNISMLMENTGTWYASYNPSNMYTIRQFMAENNNVIHSLLYYAGWGGMAVYGGLLVGFIALMGRFVGFGYYLHKPHYLIYQAAFLNLLIRAVCGILYGFGILPIPVSLPFGGSVAVVMDAVCVALLLYSEIFENMPMRQVEKTVVFDEWDKDLNKEDLPWKEDGEKS